MNPEKLFDEIGGFVAESRELLKSGAMMELAGLDNRVLLLCEEVLLLSKDERIRYEARLKKLFADLEALGDELAAKRDMIGAEMSSLPQLKKASIAYRIADARDKRKDDE